MRQAVTSPVYRSIALGALLLGAGVIAPRFMTHESGAVTHRLVLHTVSEPNAIYMTAWRNGDVTIAFENGELRPVTFHVRATLPDDCRWEGTETLVPIDGKTFAYDYSEKILSCPEGTESTYRKTPRTGLVTVE